MIAHLVAAVLVAAWLVVAVGGALDWVMRCPACGALVRQPYGSSRPMVCTSCGWGGHR